MIAEIPEPPDGTILAWRDQRGDLYAVYTRIDQHGGPDDLERWYHADQRCGDGPYTFEALLDDMQYGIGPIELVEVPS